MARRAPFTVGLATIALLCFALGLALLRRERAYRAAPGVEPEPEPEASDVREDARPAASIALESPDLEARLSLAVRVVDGRGDPIQGAKVSIRGLRSEQRPGAWFPYRGEKPVERTDPSGRARLECWEWVDAGNRSSKVDLSVEHPGYTAFRDPTFELSATERSVVLRKGATVVVGAWIGSRAELADAIEIRTDRQSELTPQSWWRQPDGRMLSERLAPGKHLLWVEHYGQAHGRCYSEIVSFELEEGAREELWVELFPAETLEGALEAAVQRPVLQGRVQIRLFGVGGPGEALSIERSFEAPILPDGSFRIGDLPRASGQVFALCKGWASRWELPELQRVAVPHGAALELWMEPTATLEVEVVGESGSPIQDADVRLVHRLEFAGGASILVPWRRWDGRSDARGRVTFEDVPALGRPVVVARREGFETDEEEGPRSAPLELRSGELARHRIVLRAIPR